LQQLTISVDGMSGDHGVKAVVPGVLSALKKHPHLTILLVGDQAILQQEIEGAPSDLLNRLDVIHASQQVEMDEAPSLALRNKKDSSMRVALDLVKQGRARACVSSGNTGALMATARFVLKTLRGIDRPALVGIMPTTEENITVRVLDLGANIDSKPEHLFQFAVMGSVLANQLNGTPAPRVALLNVGIEEMKGNEQVKKTAQMLEACPGLNYIGFVEGGDIYTGAADVIVCDGFVGNVALKSTEGAVRLVAHFIRKAFARNWFTKLSGLLAMYTLKSLGKHMNPSRYNGATMLGLRGTVIKSHGGANSEAFARAIDEAIVQVDRNIPALIEDKVAHILEPEMETGKS